MKRMSGEHTRLACWLRRPRRKILFRFPFALKVHDREGAITQVAAATAPQSKPFVLSVNGADGIGNIEGKAARNAVSFSSARRT
jgi:hypothetical protein